MGPITGSWKSPCRTSYRSSIETIVLNYLVFLRKSRFCACVHFGDRQSDKRTNRWRAPKRKAAGGLINSLYHNS